MNFEEILDQVIALLQRRGRGSYRILKLQFTLNDEALEALKEELLEVHHLEVGIIPEVVSRLSPYLGAYIYSGTSLFCQPCRIEQQEGLIIERKILHCSSPIRLEKGIGCDVDPLELVGKAALDVGTDRHAPLWLQRATPLQHHRFQLGIVHAHVVRLPAFEEAHRALVDIHQIRKERHEHVEVVLDQQPIDDRRIVHQVDLGLNTDFCHLVFDQRGNIGHGRIQVRDEDGEL